MDKLFVPKVISLAAGLNVVACAGREARTPAQPLDEGRVFAALMGRIATGWNTGDAASAADCFAEDAVYMEPPDRQRYEGRGALFEFFGGHQRPPPKMSMTFHHLAFDAPTQTGFGEYTFEGSRRYHGIVVVKLRNGKVSRWREYQQMSPLPWEAFAGPSLF
ncbi:MAG TPA: nuclear transport factor 2 family protein [Polyangiaceae bacterium]|jgi:ketosteroid isomerase-like protein|nr:nuclear transport factor 2 family protein [Polyangiaceae bacterium]